MRKRIIYQKMFNFDSSDLSVAHIFFHSTTIVVILALGIVKCLNSHVHNQRILILSFLIFFFSFSSLHSFLFSIFVFATVLRRICRSIFIFDESRTHDDHKKKNRLLSWQHTDEKEKKKNIIWKLRSRPSTERISRRQFRFLVSSIIVLYAFSVRSFCLRSRSTRSCICHHLQSSLCSSSDHRLCYRCA